MKPVSTIVGIALIALGVAALVWGGFEYTRETHDAELGPLKFEVEEKDRFEVPTWVGVTAVVVGTGVLVLGRRGRG